MVSSTTICGLTQTPLSMTCPGSMVMSGGTATCGVTHGWPHTSIEGGTFLCRGRVYKMVGTLACGNQTRGMHGIGPGPLTEGVALKRGSGAQGP